VNASDVVVRGAATPDEIAAVVAALQAREQAAADGDRYERWRRQRLSAIRPR
jgi:hypothetical protein